MPTDMAPDANERDIARLEMLSDGIFWAVTLKLAREKMTGPAR